MTDATEHKVVLTEHLSDEAAKWLAQHVRLVRCPHEDAAGLKRELADADGLIVRTYTQVNDALLDLAPKLKVAARAGVGLDNIDLDACRRRDVTVIYTPDANTQAVVEYVWALIFDALRPRVDFTGPIEPSVFHDYRARCVGRQLNTMALGIVGFGRIGRRVAQVAHAIGIRVLYHDLLTRRELDLPPDQPGEFVDPATLYAESDIVTLHVDGRPSNRRMIDAAVLDQLRPTCTLINTARGILIDAPALAAWASKVIEKGGRAILDVHDPEPPPADYALYGLPNVRLLPHLASRTHEAMLNMSWVVRDVVRVLRGEPARYPA